MTKTHPIYKREIPIQVNKSYVSMTLIQLDKLAKNVVKTGCMGEVTLASCLGIISTQANSGHSVWLPHLLESMVDSPATTRQNTAQEHGIYSNKQEGIIREEGQKGLDCSRWWLRTFYTLFFASSNRSAKCERADRL